MSTKEVIGILYAVEASLGTGTTKTQINAAKSLVLPAWARSVVAVRPIYGLGTAVTEAESCWIEAFVESDDVAVQPFSMQCTPILSALTDNSADIDTIIPEWETYPINAPINGGEELKIWGQCGVANTAAPYLAMAVIVSNQPPTYKQLYGKTGTLTASAVATGEQAGTPYTIGGATNIKEVYGMVASTTVVTDISTSGYFKLTSNDFIDTKIPVKYGFAPIPGTDGTMTNGCPAYLKQARYKLEVQTNSQCTITDSIYFDTVNTTAGYWRTGLFFER